MSYDIHCEDLARFFLEDYHHTPADVECLAQEIQDAIEDFLADKTPVVP